MLGPLRKCLAEPFYSGEPGKNASKAVCGLEVVASEHGHFEYSTSVSGAFEHGSGPVNSTHKHGAPVNSTSEYGTFRHGISKHGISKHGIFEHNTFVQGIVADYCGVISWLISEVDCIDGIAQLCGLYSAGGLFYLMDNRTLLALVVVAACY